jgi:beta-glucosidase
VDVQNTGDCDGDETVEVHLIPRNLVGAPLRALVGFDKVHLARGASTTVQLTIEPRQLSCVSPSGDRSVRPGDYDLAIGGEEPAADSSVFLPFRIQGARAIAP